MALSKLSSAEAFARALLLVDSHLFDDGYPDPEGTQQDPYTLMRRVRKLSHLDERSAHRVVQQVLGKKDTLLQQVEVLQEVMAQRRHGLLELRADPLSRRLTRIVDPDALFILAEGTDLDDADPFDWAAVPALDGGPTRDLHRQGSTETHLHLGGALPPLFFWLPLMSGELDFHTAARAALGQREKGSEERWAQQLARAAGLRLSLAATLEASLREEGEGHMFSNLPPGWDGDWKLETWLGDDFPQAFDLRSQIMHLTQQQRLAADPDLDWPFADPLRRHASAPQSKRVHYAQGERRWLYYLGEWLRKQERRAAHGPGVKTPDPDVKKVEQALLAYLRLRNAFHRLLIHDHGTEGLLRFVENFGRRRLLQQQRASKKPKKPWQRRRIRRLRRTIVKLERSRMQAALNGQLRASFDDTGPTAQRPQRRLEMRVAVPELPLLLPTIQAWLQGIRDHLRDGEVTQNSQVGLLFHLIKKKRKDRDAKPSREDMALRDAERLAFLLHEYPDVRPFVVGLDAAGNERDAQPRVFAPAFEHVRQLSTRLRRRPGEQPLRLGFTYHVGEDVDDLLTGLRHIDETVRLLLPDQAGGRLGHALALGFDTAWFYQQRGGETAPPLGEHLLDLVWAHGWLRRENGPSTLRHGVEDRLYQLLPGLKRSTLQNVFEKMRELRGHSTDQLLEVLTEDTDENRSRAERLDEPVPIRLDELPDWLEMVTWLQELMRQKLARKRLCIEANPTSNLIIGNFAGYADLPYQQWVDAKLPVSLNTDDPGLFLTSLPGEFSAVYTALTRTLTHSEALRWLAHRRFDAEQSSFLGNHVPSGAGALQELDRLFGPSSAQTSEASTLFEDSPPCGLVRGGLPRS